MGRYFNEKGSGAGPCVHFSSLPITPHTIVTSKTVSLIYNCNDKHLASVVAVTNQIFVLVNVSRITPRRWRSTPMMSAFGGKADIALTVAKRPPMIQSV
jgi:hypothetical protein